LWNCRRFSRRPHPLHSGILLNSYREDRQVYQDRHRLQPCSAPREGAFARTVLRSPRGPGAAPFGTIDRAPPPPTRPPPQAPGTFEPGSQVRWDEAQQQLVWPAEWRQPDHFFPDRLRDQQGRITRLVDRPHWNCEIGWCRPLAVCTSPGHVCGACKAQLTYLGGLPTPPMKRKRDRSTSADRKGHRPRGRPAGA